MFSLRFTLLLFLILLIPLALRHFNMEPYPAVLQPAGAQKVKDKNGQVTVKYNALYGLNSAKTWERLNITDFMYPIPVEYALPMMNTDFGLSTAAYYAKSGRYKMLKRWHLARDRKPTAAEVAEGKNWLQQKLQQHQLNTQFLKLVQHQQTLSTQTGKIIANAVAYERIIPLDK